MSVENFLVRYFDILKRLESKKVTDRKEAAIQLIEHLKSGLQLDWKQINKKFKQAIGEGFWEYTTGKVIVYWKELLRSQSKTKTGLQEGARALSQLIHLFPQIDDEDEQPLRICGLELFDICYNLFNSDDDNIFNLCADSFAPIMRRLLRCEGLLTFQNLESVLQLTLGHLRNAYNREDFFRNPSDRLKRVNFGELMHLAVQALGYSLDKFHENEMFIVGAEWIVSLGDDGRNITQCDYEIMSCLKEYMTVNPERSIDILRLQCQSLKNGDNAQLIHGVISQQRFGDLLIKYLLRSMRDRSVLRCPPLYDLLFSLGSICCTFASSFGFNRIAEEDEEWLQPASVLVNLEANSELILSSEFATGYDAGVKALADGKFGSLNDVQSQVSTQLSISYSACMALFISINDGMVKAASRLTSTIKFLRRCIERSPKYHDLLTLQYVLPSKSKSGEIAQLAEVRTLVDVAIDRIVAILEGNQSLIRASVELFWMLECVNSCLALLQDQPDIEGLVRRTWDVMVGKLFPNTLTHYQHFVLVRHSAFRIYSRLALLVSSHQSFGFVVDIVRQSFVRDLQQLVENGVPNGSAEELTAASMAVFFRSIVGLIKLDSALEGFGSDVRSLRECLLNWTFAWLRVRKYRFADSSPSLVGLLICLLDRRGVLNQQQVPSPQKSITIAEELTSKSKIAASMFQSPITTSIADLGEGNVQMLHQSAVDWIINQFKSLLQNEDMKKRHSSIFHAACALRRRLEGHLEMEIALESLLDELILMIKAECEDDIDEQSTKGILNGLKELFEVQLGNTSLLEPLRQLALSRLAAYYEPEAVDESTPAETSTTTTTTTTEKAIKRARTIAGQTQEEEEEEDLLFGTSSRSATMSQRASSSQVGKSRQVGSQDAERQQRGREKIRRNTTWDLHFYLEILSLTKATSEKSFMESLEWMILILQEESTGPQMNRILVEGIVACVARGLKKRWLTEKADVAVAQAIDVAFRIAFSYSMDPRAIRMWIDAMEFLTTNLPPVLPSRNFQSTEEAMKRVLESFFFLRKKDGNLMLRHSTLKDGFKFRPDWQVGFLKILGQVAMRQEPDASAAMNLLTHLVPGTLANPLLDPQVRCAAASLLPGVSMHFDYENARALMGDVLNIGPKGLVHDEDESGSGNSTEEAFVARNVVIALAEMACGSVSMLNSSCLELIVMASIAKKRAMDKVARSSPLKMQSFVNLFEIISSRMGYTSARHLFITNADYFWYEFLKRNPLSDCAVHGTHNFLSCFPFRALGFDSLSEALVATTSSVITCCLLCAPDLNSARGVLEYIRRQTAPEDLTNFADQVQTMLEKHKGDILGLLHPFFHVQECEKSGLDVYREVRKAHEFLHDLGSSADNLSSAQMTAAITRALGLLCCEAGKEAFYADLTADCVKSFLTSTSASGSVSEVLQDLNSCDIFMALSLLATNVDRRPGALHRVFMVVEKVLSWFDLESLVRMETEMKILVHFYVRLLLKAQELSKSFLVFAACEALSNLFGVAQKIPEREAVSQHHEMCLAGLDQLSSDLRGDKSVQELIQRLNQAKKGLMSVNPTVSKTDKPHLSAMLSVKALLNELPPRSHVPGSLSITPAFLLSISPRLTVPKCCKLLQNVLDALESGEQAFRAWIEQQPDDDDENDLLKVDDGIPKHISRTLRPLPDNFEPKRNTTTVQNGKGHQQQQQRPGLTFGLSSTSLVQNISSKPVESDEKTTPSLDSLIDLLKDLCDPDCPIAIRILSGRCLCRLRSLFPRKNFAGISQQNQMREMDMDHFYAAVLRWLYELLIHEDSAVACYASEALYKIMATGEGDRARKLLEPTLAIELAKWKRGDSTIGKSSSVSSIVDGFIGERFRGLLLKRSASPVPSSSTGGGFNSLAESRWTLLDNEETMMMDFHFGTWISNLVEGMARDGTVTADSVIRRLSKICMVEHQLSTMVFPWLIFSTVAPERNIEATKDLSLRFGECLENLKTTKFAPSGEYVHVARLLIETLNFLRGRRIRELLDFKGKGSSSSHRSRFKPGSDSDYRRFYLQIDLILVGQVAVKFGFPTTSLMCAELANEWSKASVQASTSTSPARRLLSFYDHGQDMNEIDRLMLDSFRLLGDEDGLAGVRRPLNLRSRIDGLASSKQWLSAAIGYDQLLLRTWSTTPTAESFSDDLVLGQAECFGRMGLVHAMGATVSSSVDTQSSALSDAKCEALWRSRAFGGMADPQQQQNRLPLMDISDHRNRLSFHRLFVSALACLESGDENQLKEICTLGRDQLLSSLCSTESSEILTTTLSRLSLILDVETVSNVLKSTNENLDLGAFNKEWSVRRMANEENLLGREALLRLAMMNSGPVHQRSSPNSSGSASVVELNQLLVPNLVLLNEVCRAQGQSILAHSALDRLEQHLRESMSTTSSSSTRMTNDQQQQQQQLLMFKMETQKSMAYWSGGETQSALQCGFWVVDSLSNLISQQQSSASSIQAKMTLESIRTLIGFWLGRNSSMSSREIRERWLGTAVNGLSDLLSGLKSSSSSSTKVNENVRNTEKLLGEAHSCLASFLDRQFRSLEARINSPEYKASMNAHEERIKELRNLKDEKDKETDPTKKKDLLTKIGRLERECRVDANEIQSLRVTHSDLLVQAFSHLITSLKFGAAEQQTVFRILQLWFAHAKTCEELSNIVHKQIIEMNAVPTAKFVPLSYQILSRISAPSGSTLFDSTLHQLVVKMCCEHPYHVLPHLFCLAFAVRISANSKDRSSDQAAITKSKRAEKCLNEVERKSVFLRTACNGLRELYQAFIALAYFDHQGPKGQLSDLKSCPGFNEHYGRVPKDTLALPVKTIPLRADLDYSPSNLVTLRQIKPKYRTAEFGINAPKIVEMEGSDSVVAKALVKGKDDLRQDAVMEQMLAFVSALLESSSSSKNQKNNQRIRTYNVLPLTPEAGLIEWVDNTMPIGSYLYGGQSSSEFAASAHGRHNPGDKTFIECFKIMRAAHEESANNGVEKRVIAFREVKAHFRPAFRHFFYERFGHDPVEWYQRRDAYTRSTAANSMVGMILGIGDRHSQNILIDERTAEVVHIDFGVTFEQGKALRTPETVPFRLTADIIDGFGSSGINGVFTKSCEETLRVLRDHTEAVLTICEVFVHDPLHRWTVNPTKLRRIEHRGEDDEGKVYQLQQQQQQPPKTSFQALEAGRVLSRLRQKLQGIIDDGEALAVEAQVQRCIQEATDETNLAHLYYGWAPWL